MLESRGVTVEVVACVGRPQELDALIAPPGARACRVAPDELLLVALDGADARPPGASVLVIDQTDGFAAWSLAGPTADEVFARLSAIPLPPARPAFAQGTVAAIPGKVLFEEDQILVLVPSVFAHHLCERIAAVTA